MLLYTELSPGDNDGELTDLAPALNKPVPHSVASRLAKQQFQFQGLIATDGAGRKIIADIYVAFIL